MCILFDRCFFSFILGCLNSSRGMKYFLAFIVIPFINCLVEESDLESFDKV